MLFFKTKNANDVKSVSINYNITCSGCLNLIRVLLLYSLYYLIKIMVYSDDSYEALRMQCMNYTKTQEKHLH